MCARVSAGDGVCAIVCVCGYVCGCVCVCARVGTGVGVYAEVSSGVRLLMLAWVRSRSGFVWVNRVYRYRTYWE